MWHRQECAEPRPWRLSLFHFGKKLAACDKRSSPNWWQSLRRHGCAAIYWLRPIR
ncbi:Uncharacterised protein [Vibrio cholerae]|nr:Uncharacterised protein [Vibrio cholerae]